MKADVPKEGLFHRMHRHFDEAATYVAHISGRPAVFAVAVLVVVVWR